MHPTECTFTASGFRREEFDHFMSIARELGIKVDCAVSSSGKTATVHVSDMPDVQDAETMRTRRAGRPSKGVVLPHDSIFNNETTCAEYLAWQQNHSVEEGMRQLGLKRTTYFRRLNSIKKAVEAVAVGRALERRPQEERHEAAVSAARARALTLEAGRHYDHAWHGGR